MPNSSVLAPAWLKSPTRFRELYRPTGLSIHPLRKRNLLIQPLKGGKKREKILPFSGSSCRWFEPDPPLSNRHRKHGKCQQCNNGEEQREHSDPYAFPSLVLWIRDDRAENEVGSSRNGRGIQCRQRIGGRRRSRSPEPQAVCLSRATCEHDFVHFPFRRNILDQQRLRATVVDGNAVCGEPACPRQTHHVLVHFKPCRCRARNDARGQFAPVPVARFRGMGALHQKGAPEERSVCYQSQTCQGGATPRPP